MEQERQSETGLSTLTSVHCIHSTSPVAVRQSDTQDKICIWNLTKSLHLATEVYIG